MSTSNTCAYTPVCITHTHEKIQIFWKGLILVLYSWNDYAQIHILCGTIWNLWLNLSMVWGAEYYYRFCWWANTKSKRMTQGMCSSHMSTKLQCFVLLCQAQWHIPCICSAFIHWFMEIPTFPVITMLLALPSAQWASQERCVFGELEMVIFCPGKEDHCVFLMFCSPFIILENSYFS